MTVAPTTELKNPPTQLAILPAQLIVEEKLKWAQHLKYKNQRIQIFALWEDYVAKNWMERNYSVGSARSTKHAREFKLLLYTVIYFAALVNLYFVINCILTFFVIHCI